LGFPWGPHVESALQIFFKNQDLQHEDISGKENKEKAAQLGLEAVLIEKIDKPTIYPAQNC
jgi:hypothetical protein